MNYDFVIIGAGLSGGVIARKIAEELNKKVLIVERRNHISGNMYDYTDEHGIKVQKYGPHTFHTKNKVANDFVSRFCTPVPYKTKCEAVIDHISTPSPFNFKTIEQFNTKEKANFLKNILIEFYKGMEEVTVVDMLQCQNEYIRNWAQFLFDKDYKLYTAKQWNLNPADIDPSVLKRVPIVLSYRDTYFDDEYEFIPKEGFTDFYTNLIDHPNITVKTGIDALPLLSIDEENNKIQFEGKNVNVVYTGAIDELFSYKLGVLPYRSLLFKFMSYKTDSFQNTAIVAYPQVKDYTRITEYTKMPYQKADGWTTVAYEYPLTYQKDDNSNIEPYYPVLTESSKKLYEQYSLLAKNFSNLTLCGRLADFKYYNMDQCVIRALDIFNSIKEKYYGSKV